MLGKRQVNWITHALLGGSQVTQSLRKIAWLYLLKLNAAPYDLTTACLDIHPKEMNT